MENGLKVMLFLGCAAALFFFLSKVFSAFGKSKSKSETVFAVVLLIVVVIAFVVIFGVSSTSSAPWERLQRR
ncbi:hypothetical protein ACVNIS_06550 [Sphaerotilaceae bacterium SBD11-9]